MTVSYRTKALSVHNSQIVLPVRSEVKIFFIGKVNAIVSEQDVCGSTSEQNIG